MITIGIIRQGIDDNVYARCDHFENHTKATKLLAGDITFKMPGGNFTMVLCEQCMAQLHDLAESADLSMQAKRLDAGHSTGV